LLKPLIIYPFHIRPPLYSTHLIMKIQNHNPPKANEEMQAVLDQLAALGGKPIEQLTPQEARRQPTPADAVKALLKQRGQSVQIVPARRQSYAPRQMSHG
jgi:hypothetical protein